MPPRSNPSARQQRLGAELRKLREDAGLSTEQAAALLDTNRTVISSTEAGRHGISPERVRRIAFAYECTDQALIDALATMCAERVQGWWEDYREVLPSTFLDIAELEWHAHGLRVSTMIHMPGQFQTEAYARALFRAAIPPLPEAEFEARVAHRVQRHQAIDRPDAPPYELVVHEGALRTEVGGRTVLRDQLTHLVAAAERDNVTIQAIPFSAGAFPGSGQSILYARARVPRLDTALADRVTVGEFVHAEAHLCKYRLQLDEMQRIALPPEKTLDLINAIASQL
ncbi:helix-turn-helix domain-containing protein [Actinacidiphila bryophytorum]|uniref:Helix-turn-helix domain-containing protein n=1 Tax=Actinacidiphila bryophytorum TaxID=1436133 RepID=A0A9W4MJR7_9ACTN|nr:helix-turn-helix transcriptional regulator [Actinacidiphila bryophytorum]MBM9437419.1 helix-turn-helix domain-containing protein [Actinacidiphila bryophytorum]MBN6546427.1 helix-turn-helix domain-containing protein [Actinacidiphila bryophytorum]CAG7652049.1 Helix-turn-helix domain-containing protein [Actinacidiphila bryophytorum]